MKTLIMILLIVCIITSCGQSKFDKSMRAGKDFIQSGHYDEAINQFDIALIEKPTDKDAQILMERSKQESDNKKSKEILAKYQEGNSPIFLEYMKIWLETNSKEVSGVFEKLNTIEKLKVVYNNSLELGRKYKKYSRIADAHNEFVEALDDYIKMFEEAKNGSQFKVTQYKRLHEEQIQNYKDKIATLQGE